MSSILTALKKAEEAGTTPRNAEAWSHPFDTGDAIRKQARRSRMFRTMGAALVILVLLGAGVWLVYGRLDFFHGLVIALTNRPSDPGITARDADVTAPVDSVPKKRTPQEKSLKAPDPRPLPRRTAPAVETAVRSPSHSPSIEADVPEPEGLGGPKASSDHPAEDMSAGILDTKSYRLEAIVWSDNPSSRFAVINGNIVRAGAIMKDVTVKAIQQDGVILQSGGKTGELRFTLD